MIKQEFKRIPNLHWRHTRWKPQIGRLKRHGQVGRIPSRIIARFQTLRAVRGAGVQELTLYGFTVDNTKRPTAQKKAFQKACVEAVKELANRDAELLVVGNTESPNFLSNAALHPPRQIRRRKIKVNFLVNYG